MPVTAGLGLRRVWAATIDYTPDHVPIIGLAPGLERVFVASAGGAGMMWGYVRRSCWQVRSCAGSTGSL